MNPEQELFIFRKFAYMSSLGHGFADLDGKIIYINPALCRMLGEKKPKNALGKNVAIYYPDDVRNELVKKILPMVKRKGEWYGELLFKSLKGNILHTIQDISLITDEQGKPLYFSNVITDITQRKEIAKELEREKELAEKYLNIVKVMIIGIDRKKKVMLVNKMGCEVLGYKRDKILGKNWVTHFIPNRMRRQVSSVANQLFEGKIAPLEYYENPVLTKTGEERIIAWHNTILKDDKGEITGLLSSGEDITERRKFEETLKQTLREKETLLNEVHHRVKNNLLTLYSLVNLQKISSHGNEVVTQALEDTKQRISAMGKVHRMLYVSKNFSEIDFAQYIKSLIEEIKKTYGSEKKHIQVAVDLDPILLNIETAIPCGLIVNELLVNSFRHAFPGKKKGRIKVSLKEKGKKIELMVKDNGKGMDANPLRNKTKSLGLRLVVMLIQQIKGKIAYKGERGSLFTINFKSAKIS